MKSSPWLVRRFPWFHPFAGLAIFLGFLMSCGAEPSATDDPATILQRISNKAVDHLLHLPNYTCHEAIDRLVSPLNDNVLRQHDRVELQVGFIGQEELFARIGDTHIQESSITNLIATGAIGNGLFGALAESVFVGGAASFDYMGVIKTDGRMTYRYDFRVPVEKSSFSVGHNEADAIVAYQGSILADFNTLDLVRLDLKADQFPPYLRLSSVKERAEYKLVRIRSSEFCYRSTPKSKWWTVQGI